MTTVEPASYPDSGGAPRWIVASLDVKEGRDPLGLQTTTQDRLMPRLLPGVLELSRRARYLSFHAYMLDKYRELRLPADGGSLSAFLKAREWEYGLAVLNCPHGCESSPVGAQRLRAMVNHQDPPYPRGESVESAFGGYGLYYRSPLAELGIVARAGTLLGDTPTTVDVLYNTDRARQLAATFREAIVGTRYATSWMLTSDPIPLDVLVEYADVACLCQLRSRAAERDAVNDALFGSDPVEQRSEAAAAEPELHQDADAEDESLSVGAAVIQRRRSFAHYLTLVDAAPAVIDDEGAYRQAMWAPPGPRSSDHERVAGQWAGLIAKDVWQDALCSIWSEFCRAGVNRSLEAQGEGLSWDTVREMARTMVDGPPSVPQAMPTLELVDAIATGGISLPGMDKPVAEVPLEELRTATDELDTATSGLIVILELHRRTHGRSDPGWMLSSNARSAWQLSLATVLDAITEHVGTDSSVGDTLWWLTNRFILNVHERIAYSKLPEHTFRFRWEEGRIRFFNNGVGRFPLAAIRNEPLASLTSDLDLWRRQSSGEAELTALGRAFVEEALP